MVQISCKDLQNDGLYAYGVFVLLTPHFSVWMGRGPQLWHLRQIWLHSQIKCFQIKVKVELEQEATLSASWHVVATRKQETEGVVRRKWRASTSPGKDAYQGMKVIQPV